MIRTLVDRLRDLWWLFKQLQGAEEDDRFIRRPAGARDTDVAVYGVNWRQIENWRGAGKLSRIQPSGPTGPALVDLHELRDYIEASRVPPTAGPLVDAPRRLREAVDALASRYEDDPRPGSDVHALLVELGERIDRAIQE